MDIGEYCPVSEVGLSCSCWIPRGAEWEGESPSSWANVSLCNNVSFVDVEVESEVSRVDIACCRRMSGSDTLGSGVY